MLSFVLKNANEVKVGLMIMRLILNGDDFGMSRGVNFGMIDCYREGLMTSCSMMTNMPGAEHAAELMRENFGLSVGIHLNLTVGKPLVAGHKTLVKPDGTFNKGMLVDSTRVDIAEIRKELNAQFDYYIELVGSLPDHINSHHGIEQIKGATQVIYELAELYQLPVRQFMHYYHDDIIEDDRLPYEIPRIKFIADTADGGVENVFAAFTAEELASNDLYEVALHPGYVDADVLHFSSYTTTRSYDAEVFMGAELRQWIEENNIELVAYQAAKLLERGK